MNRRYYSMDKRGNEADINIYGDIASCGWTEDDHVSAKSLSNVLDELTDVTRINVYINSYGGEVAEGLAIYNALKRHKAKVTTYCDGFAASIASVIFMAGDKRVMSESSLLMIHNAWTITDGNAEQLRKAADDLEKITQASVNAYKAVSTLTEEKIKSLMDAETWILPEEAIEWGFATSIQKSEKRSASQSALKSLFELLRMKADPEEEKPDEEESDKEESDDESEDEKNGSEDESKEGDEYNPDEDEENAKGGEKKPKNHLETFFKAILKM